MSVPSRRPSRAAAMMMAAVGGSAVLVAGCTTSPGAAALVGGDRISQESLQQTVTRALANPTAAQQLGQDRAGFVRTELARLITDDVVVRAAADQHVSVTDAEVQQQIDTFAQQAGGMPQLLQQAAAGGVPASELHTFIRYYLLQQRIADKLLASVPVSADQLQAAYQKNIDTFDQVNSAHILVKDKKTADSLLAQVKANPASFAALAARYSIDTGSKSQGGNLGFAPRSQFVKPFADAIFAAKPGEFLEVQSQFGWHVVHVIAHKTTTLAQATPQLKQQLLSTQRQALLAQALTKASKELGVHVNPRYGSWDAAKQQVVAPSGGNDLSSPAPTHSS